MERQEEMTRPPEEPGGLEVAVTPETLVWEGGRLTGLFSRIRFKNEEKEGSPHPDDFRNVGQRVYRQWDGGTEKQLEYKVYFLSVQLELADPQNRATFLCNSWAGIKALDRTISQQRYSILSRQRDGSLSRQIGSILSRQMCSTLSRQRGSTLSRQREITLSRQRGSTLSRQREITLSRQRGSTLSRQREITLSRQRGSTLSRQREITLSRQRGSTLSRQRGSTLSGGISSTRSWDGGTLGWLELEILPSAIFQAVSWGGRTLDRIQRDLLLGVCKLLKEVASRRRAVLITDCFFVQVGLTNTIQGSARSSFMSYQPKSLSRLHSTVLGMLSDVDDLEAVGGVPGSSKGSRVLGLVHRRLVEVKDKGLVPESVVIENCDFLQIGLKNHVQFDPGAADGLFADLKDDESCCIFMDFDGRRKPPALNGDVYASVQVQRQPFGTSDQGDKDARSGHHQRQPLGTLDLDLRTAEAELLGLIRQLLLEMLEVVRGGPQGIEVWYRDCPNVQIGFLNSVAYQDS